MKRFITRLADTYWQIYVQHRFAPEDDDIPFAIVRSRSAAVHKRYLSGSSPDWLEDITDKHDGGYSAELVVSRAGSWPGSAADDYVPRRENRLNEVGHGGFTAVIYESLLYKQEMKSQRSVWKRVYPVAVDW